MLVLFGMLTAGPLWLLFLCLNQLRIIAGLGSSCFDELQLIADEASRRCQHTCVTCDRCAFRRAVVGSLLGLGLRGWASPGAVHEPGVRGTTADPHRRDARQVGECVVGPVRNGDPSRRQVGLVKADRRLAHRIIELARHRPDRRDQLFLASASRRNVLRCTDFRRRCDGWCRRYGRPWRARKVAGCRSARSTMPVSLVGEHSLPAISPA